MAVPESSRKSQRIIAFLFVGLLLGFGPLVSALTESAPSLVWSRNFLGGTGGSEFLSSGCASNRDTQVVDVDWVSGDVFLDITERLGFESGTRDGATTFRIRSATGGTVWQNSDSTLGSDVRTCAGKLDQRGRYYVAHVIPGGPGRIVVYSKIDGTSLASLLSGEIAATGAVKVDLFSNVTDPHPSVVFTQGSGHFPIYKPSSATTYSQVCPGTVIASYTDAAWRDDTISRALWVSGTAGVRRINPETCVILATGTIISTVTQDNMKIHFGEHIAAATIDAFYQNTATLWGRTRFDASDVTDPLGTNSTQTIGLAGIDPAATSIGSSAVEGYYVANDGHPLVCGRYLAGAVGMGFLARLDSALSNWAWNITFADSSFRVDGCALGTAGAVYVYGADNSATPAQAQIRKYCCISGSVRSTTTVQAIVAPGAPELPPSAGDIGTGIAAFFSGIGCASTGGLFFCGLVLVVVSMVSTGAAFTSLTKSKLLAMLAASLVGLAIMIFLTAIGVWPVVAVAVLTVLSAAVITFLLRRQFLGA